MRWTKVGLTVLTAIATSTSVVSSAFAGVVTYTGSNGKITTVQTDRTRVGNDGTFNRTTTYPSGKTSSSTGSYTTDGNGGYTGTVNRINRQGQTNNYSVTGQRTFNNGYQNIGTITNANGQVTSYNRAGSCVGNTCTGTGTVTFSDGKNRVTNVTGQRTGLGKFSGATTTTGRNGQVRTGTFTRQR